MLYGQDRGAMRDVFFTAWRKHLHNEPLDAMEQRIVDIINMHPEYHELFNDPEKNKNRDFDVDGKQQNPFMHIAMHLTLAEQLGTDQPRGIRQAYQHATSVMPDTHAVEHIMVDILMQMMWDTMQSQQAFDEKLYLERIAKAFK